MLRGQRILICAPSNAAVDEIARRIMCGLQMDGGDYFPRIARLGRLEKTAPDVQPVHIKELVKSYRRSGDSYFSAMKQILAQSDVVCATLSGSGTPSLMALGFGFETVIIDEAGQTVEPSCLIPLKYGCRKCVLVGDPQQLPPTVLSQTAPTANYSRSLFDRLMFHQSQRVLLLDTQYRMHPQISQFPSNTFYQGQLQDGPNMEGKTSRAWHNNSLFPPYVFLDVAYGNNIKDGTSWKNMDEVLAALDLFSRFRQEYPPSKELQYTVGVVTPYKPQLEELENAFVNKFGKDISELVTFQTVDGFQGQEKDIMIISCVRAGSGSGVGFLNDKRRMNVALTRAKSSLFVLGDANRLASDEHWRALVDDAKVRGNYRKVRSPWHFWSGKNSLIDKCLRLGDMSSTFHQPPS
ncbi:P-loop containing nucleoside triphosphate hydrolase protein [Meredithblackwellia eburnea MCA 4105]